jgi:sulfate adenylyltransferase subunit 1 (EFTu-like GTPase family)/uncharacterized membrane protein
MDWYGGPTLLGYLEDVPIAAQSRRQTFRMPIQLVNRPSPQFRGYSGRIAGGEVFPGMPVTILPSGQISSVDRIVTYDGDLERAEAGQSVSITLADDIDASRGDVIAELAAPPAVTDRLTARVVWMGKDALAPGRSYLIKAAAATAKANVEPAIKVFDLDTGDGAPADRLFINDIGDCVLTLDRPLALDPYADSKETGSFILIDPESFDTVGMGLVQGTAGEERQTGRLRRALRWILGAASASARKRSSSRESRLRSIVKAVSWRGTGSVDTFIVTFVVTGNYTFAGSVALTEIATKVMLYYFHERVWSLIPWGR